MISSAKNIQTYIYSLICGLVLFHNVPSNGKESLRIRPIDVLVEIKVMLTKLLKQRERESARERKIERENFHQK